MSDSIAIPSNYGLVAAVVAASYAVHHLYMSFGVVKARKKYGVEYPNLYASKENCKNEDNIRKFNCVQRGHQNSLEGHAAFLATLLAAGLEAPVTAASLGSIYLLGRVFYFAGYSTGEPSGRHYGAVGYIGMLGLVGICIKMGASAVASLLH